MSLIDEYLDGMDREGNDCKNCFRLIIFGAAKTGKTCIIDWFLGKRVKDEYIPTIEDYHKKIFKIKGEVYRLDILDTSGHDPSPSTKKLNIMTIVYSIDDIDSFNQMKQTLELIFELKRTKNVPILVLGNKIDYLLEKKVSSRCVDLLQIQSLFSPLKTCAYSEVSCRDSIGMESAFEKLFSISNLPNEMIPSRHRRLSLNLDPTSDFLTRKNDSKLNTATNYLNSNQANNENSITLENNSVTGNPIQTDPGSQHAFDRKRGIKKSFKKTFGKSIPEAVGTVWLNARRPSIRAELKLMTKKTSNGNFVENRNKKNKKNKSKTNNNNDFSADFINTTDEKSNQSSFKTFFKSLFNLNSKHSNKTTTAILPSNN